MEHVMGMDIAGGDPRRTARRMVRQKTISERPGFENRELATRLELFVMRLIRQAQCNRSNQSPATALFARKKDQNTE